MNSGTRHRGVFGFGLVTLFMVAVLVALGVWQLQRRTEKHALIAALTERLAEPPVALPSAAQWSTLNPAHDEFRRVSFVGRYARLPDAMVYSSGSAVRPDVPGPVTWAFLPARLEGGDIVVVNAGFIENTMQDRAVQDRAVARLVGGEAATLTGYIRFPEGPGLFTPAENRDKRLWFARDHLAMASALGWGIVAPFYIDLEKPVPDAGIPKPGSLDVHLKDDHLQYAITWFALALMLLLAFGLWVRGRQQR